MSPNRSALLVMDVQKGIVRRFVSSVDALAPFQRAAAAARASGVFVIFIKVAFRDGYPEVSKRNKSFSTISTRGSMTLSDASTELHEALSPRPDEPTVNKLRVSAFTGSDLEVVLRAREIRALVLAGIATSGVVLSTVREAADMDYELTVLSDACLDADPEVHRVLVEKIFPRQAEVTTVDAWASSLKASR